MPGLERVLLGPALKPGSEKGAVPLGGDGN